MRFPRSSGVLLHITSLPSKFGIGDLGPEAYRFVDWLVNANQGLWQILPFGVADAFGCPYSGLSAFGGYPLLISPEMLMQDELLTQAEVDSCASSGQRIKMHLFRLAFGRFMQNKEYAKQLEDFHQQEDWPNDLAYFLVLNQKYGQPWTTWPNQLNQYPQAIKQKELFAPEIAFQEFLQFIFFKQWNDLKRYANSKKIQLIGDIPIFVSHHSMDVWKHQELFKLNERGELFVSTGAPPDIFCQNGQKWGAPNYRWNVMKQNDYHWWKQRLEFMIKHFNIVRLDHFRSFESTWEIPLEIDDPRGGHWVKGPGSDLFRSLANSLKELPIIVEDLGDISPEVYDIRDEFDFTGMKVLQFAFGHSKSEAHLPYLYNHNCVVYTATHDNDTTMGHFKNVTNQLEKEFICQQLNINNLNNINWDLIKMAMNSCADMAIIPLQDILGLGSEARFNIPGTTEGNWSWRFNWSNISPTISQQLKEISINAKRNRCRE